MNKSKVTGLEKQQARDSDREKHTATRAFQECAGTMVASLSSVWVIARSNLSQLPHLHMNVRNQPPTMKVVKKMVGVAPEVDLG